MAITKVRVKINGAWNLLTKDSTGKWTGSITAPSTTSYNLSGGYYPVSVELTNDAGTVRTYEATDAMFGEDMRLVVKEKLKPTVALVQPTNGSYVTNNKQPITFKATDEAGGSGVKLSTVTLKIGTETYGCDSDGMTYSSITNGYQFVYTPQSALTDGSHTITINASDNDGNAAAAVTATIKVDTVPPTLTIESPEAGLITNKAALMVSGKTNDAMSSPVSVSMTLNGASAGTAEVGSDGVFSKELTLKEGDNTITVTAKDSAGKASSVMRTVKLDTSIPEIRTLTMMPNPADVSASVTITIEVV